MIVRIFGCVSVIIGCGRGRRCGHGPSNYAPSPLGTFYSILIDVPEDERPHASLLPRIIHRAPPSPQHDHATRQDHTFICPAPNIDFGIVIHLVRVTKVVVAESSQGVEVFHHGNTLPAGDLLLRRQCVQDAVAMERFGVGSRAAELLVVDSALRGGGFGGKRFLVKETPAWSACL